MSEATLPLLEPQPPTASHGVRRSSVGRANNEPHHCGNDDFTRGLEINKRKTAANPAITRARRILRLHLFTWIIKNKAPLL
jgi:hypothetical protein